MKQFALLIAAALYFVPTFASAQVLSGTVNAGAGYIGSPVYDCATIQRQFAQAWTTAAQNVTVVQVVPCGYANFYIVRGQFSTFTVRQDNLQLYNTYPAPQPQPYPQPAPGPVYGSPVGHGNPPAPYPYPQPQPYPQPYPQPQPRPTGGTVNQGAGYIPSAMYDCNQIVANFAHDWTSAAQYVTVLSVIPCGQHNYYVVQGSSSVFTVRDTNLFF